MTQELKEKGNIREVIRFVQDMRKEAGYKPKHKIVIRYEAEGDIANLLSQQQTLKLNIGAKEFTEGIKPKEIFDIQKELQIDGKKFVVGMRRI